MTDLRTRLLDVLDIIAAAEHQFAQTDEHQAYYGDRHQAINEAVAALDERDERIKALEAMLTECREYVEGYEPYNSAIGARQNDCLAKLDNLLTKGSR